VTSDSPLNKNIPLLRSVRAHTGAVGLMLSSIPPAHAPINFIILFMLIKYRFDGIGVLQD
jgi:hypothetical protein